MTPPTPGPPLRSECLDSPPAGEVAPIPAGTPPQLRVQSSEPPPTGSSGHTADQAQAL